VESVLLTTDWVYTALCSMATCLGNIHAHTRLTALFPGLPRWAGTRQVKPVWILLKQETVSSSGISWAICKSAFRCRQITMPAPHHSVFFTGRMPFLPPNQQRQSTEGMLLVWGSVGEFDSSQGTDQRSGNVMGKSCLGKRYFWFYIRGCLIV